jgi:hypothetical protein
MSEPHVHIHSIQHPAHGSVPPPKSITSTTTAVALAASPGTAAPGTALPSTARPGVPVSPRLEARGPLWHDLLTEATEQERLARAAEAEAFARLQQLGRVAHAD